MGKRIATSLSIALVLSILPPQIVSATVNTSHQNRCAGADYSQGWVSRENARIGTPGWDTPVKHEKQGSVSGWFDQTSVACGDTVGLHLSGNGRPVKIQIFRMGYYSGAKARLILSEELKSVPKASAPIVAQNVTHLTSTNWPVSSEIQITSNFPTGIYMARVDDGGTAGYSPLIVRDDSSTSSLIMIAATLTWQAYNTWGGWSLYHGPNPKIFSPGRIVSFNRPYDRNGMSDYTVNDAGIVQTAESRGLNISYTDDVYVDGHPETLLAHKSVIYDGHPEYWTSAMREAALRARDAGTNLLFLGANSAYWKVRIENSGRRIVSWKGDPSDPYANNPALITNKWGADPTPLNESELLGALMAGFGVMANYQVRDATTWPFAGTGLRTEDLILGVVGKEVETTDIGAAPAVQTFLTSRVTILGIEYNINFTYYTTSSHSGVIDVGTNGWICGITNTCSWKTSTTPKSRSQIAAITAQVLSAAAIGPLGLTHPAVTNIPARIKLQKICNALCPKDVEQENN